MSPPLSPENMQLWNRAGLVACNGCVTMSLLALDLLLTHARSRPALSAVGMLHAREAELSARIAEIASDEVKLPFLARREEVIALREALSAGGAA